MDGKRLIWLSAHAEREVAALEFAAYRSHINSRTSPLIYSGWPPAARMRT